MTPGQHRALDEFARLCANSEGAIEFVSKEVSAGDNIELCFTLLIGNRDRAPGGLNLREREDFLLYVPPEYPFAKPNLATPHKRFAGFPHVTWSRWICLYQSALEWVPTDGLFGFFERLDQWLSSAAKNDMDPPEGPLEPPHYFHSASAPPIVVTADSPVQAGESWLGLAELSLRENYVELTGWHDLAEAPGGDAHVALVVIVDAPLPMEFPRKGSEFFAELDHIGVDEDKLLGLLSLAASVTKDGEPLHLVLGTPMRRAADGTPLVHFAAWFLSATCAKCLRLAQPEATDTDAILEIRDELRHDILGILRDHDLTWCRILEDRSEVVTRRDSNTPVAWFAGKRVLVLGCGALGSWAAEIVARSLAHSIHLVDNGQVSPGLLARQNYERTDIASWKSVALANRLDAVAGKPISTAHSVDAWTFLREHSDELNDYDVVIDCTASQIFQMKLERDWQLLSKELPPFVSFLIDSTARHGLFVVIPPSSQTGIWDAYIKLKYHLCTTVPNAELLDVFYGESSTTALFQPEPGCSDPTFRGSMADIISNVGSLLNVVAEHLSSDPVPAGGIVSQPSRPETDASVVPYCLPEYLLLVNGPYRICILKKVWHEMRGWINQSSRIRHPSHETGGLIWGHWDDTTGVIWVFDASGPPPDSIHDAAHFRCGVKGTAAEHNARFEKSRGTSGFIGMWHSHPKMPSVQSDIDKAGMALLVSAAGHNQRRALMVIIGTAPPHTTAGVYAYESPPLGVFADALQTASIQVSLKSVFA